MREWHFQRFKRRLFEWGGTRYANFHIVPAIYGQNGQQHFCTAWRVVSRRCGPISRGCHVREIFAENCRGRTKRSKIKIFWQPNLCSHIMCVTKDDHCNLHFLRNISAPILVNALFEGVRCALISISNFVSCRRPGGGGKAADVRSQKRSAAVGEATVWQEVSY